MPTKIVPNPRDPIPMFALLPTAQNTLHAEAAFERVIVLNAPTVRIPGTWKIHMASGLSCASNMMLSSGPRFMFPDVL